MEQLVRLGDVCTVVSGSTPKTSVDEYWNGDVKWITPAELDADSYYIHDSVKHITELGRTKTGLSYMPVGTVILSSRAPIGKTAILGCEMCCNQGFKNLICTDRIFNEYLYHFLRAKTNYLNSLGRGATFKELSKGIVENVLIPLPAIEEQHHIADLFASVEELIQTKKQQLDLFDELVKSRFIELFGSLNDNEKGLDIVSIEELCTLIKDGTHQTPTYTEDKQNGFKFLSSKDVMTQKICWDDIKYIPAGLHEKLYATIQPQRNDILMSKNGVNYGVAAVNDTDEIFDIYVSLALLRPRTDMVNPVYLRCVINNPDTKRQFDSSI
ncbi:MAG: restriction endonuclease subunit S, partial [Clostridia bacterium]|nr:restriction endonuclease subunit S [Clostridia bacterium]